MVPRADEIVGAMVRVLFIVVGAWAFSQVAMLAYHGAERMIGALVGF